MIEILRERRSVRKYLEKKIEDDKIKILEESLLRSPTSRNRQPWKFILVDDKILIAQLSKSKEHGSVFMKNAPLAVVICGNEKESDVWIEDCSIAATNLQMTAESLDLGSCWIQIRGRNHNSDLTSEKYIQNLLKIPTHIHVECIIAIGYPDEKKVAIEYKSLPFNKIKRNDSK